MSVQEGFEQLMLSELVCNSDFSSKVFHYINDAWFEADSSTIVFNIAKEHVQKYNSLPTKEALLIELEQLAVTETMFNDTVDYIKGIEKNDALDQQWLIDQSEKWAKNRAAHVALAKCIDIQSGEDATRNPMAMPDIMEEAVSINFTTDLGHCYFRDSEKFYKEYYRIPDRRFPFEIDELNRLTKGGTAKETLNVILAGINTGKSTFLINDACEKTLRGHNCLYISLEMSEDVCRERCDVRMLDLVFGDAENMGEIEYMSKLDFIKNNGAGELYIKDFPSGSAGVSNFKTLIREIELRDGIKFDFVYIDYITLMKSDWLADKMRGNTNTYFGSVATELRGFFKEVDVCGWTAAQLSRSKQSSDSATLADIGLAIEISAIADFMLFVAQPDELRSQNAGVASIMKNRYHFEKDKFLLGMDVSKQLFYNYEGDSEVPEDSGGEEGAKNDPVVKNTESGGIFDVTKMAEDKKPDTSGLTFGGNDNEEADDEEELNFE